MEDAVDRARRSDAPWIEARAMECQAEVATARGDLAGAEAKIRAAVALARARLDAWSNAMALNALGDLLRVQGRTDQAGPAYDESRALFESLAAERYAPQGILHNLGYVALASGDLALAAKIFMGLLGRLSLRIRELNNEIAVYRRALAQGLQGTGVP